MHEDGGGPPALQTIVLTAVAMLAFAANSLLCRLALPSDRRADWLAAAMLFAYVAFFSFAYLTLPAGAGALILFGAVQLTMFSAGLRAGERFGAMAWLGFAAAIMRLVYLVSPGAVWGVYSLRGRSVADALAATAGNFARAVPFAFVLSALCVANVHAAAAGVALAMSFGRAHVRHRLCHLVCRDASRHRAVVGAADRRIGGVAFLSEAITPRMAVASAAILGGIALVLTSRTQKPCP